MSLPDDEVLQLLSDEFVLGNENIEREEHVGLSHGYRPTDTAVGTTNGAGGRNVQLVVLAADGTVLHVLPGYWHPEDLVEELRFALRLHRLWNDASRSRADKEAMYRAMHRAFVRRLDDDTRGRSRWQSFDARQEMQRSKDERRDTVACGEAGGCAALLPICDLVHRRMLARPFVPFDEFDMESFVDYGRPFYDNNSGYDEGRDFRRAIRSNRARERAKAKERARYAKLSPHTR